MGEASTNDFARNTLGYLMRSGWKNEHVPIEVRELMDLILDSSFGVHRALGPGLLESVYRRCLVHALRSEGLRVEEEVWMAITFQNIQLEHALRADIMVEGTIVIEVKSVESLIPVHRAQLRSYLKMSGLPAGLLANFNVAYFRQGYDRIVHPDLLQRGHLGTEDPRTLAAPDGRIP